MDLQRGFCTLCNSNTKIVVPPQASSITNIIKSAFADQIVAKEFSSINSTLRACPLCLQNLLTIKMLSKNFKRYLSSDSDNCCLCEEDDNLVLIKDHVHLGYLLDGTKYEGIIDDCLMCLDCFKCLDMMRSIRTNLIKKYPQVSKPSSEINNRSPLKITISKKGIKKNGISIYLRHLKTLSQTKYNSQRFRKDFTLLHKICYVKLGNVDLLHLKKTYVPEQHTSRRKNSLSKKCYRRSLSPSPPQNFFKIRMRSGKTPPVPLKEEKKSPSTRNSSSRVSPKIKDSSPPPTRPKRQSSHYSPPASLPSSVRPKREATRHSTTPVKPKTEKFRYSPPPTRQRESPKKPKPLEAPIENTRKSRIKSQTNFKETGKKLIVNVPRLSVDDEAKVDEDDSIVVEENDPLAIADPLAISDDDDSPLVKTPTKASRKMMPDSNSSKKRKSVTFAEKNVEIEYEKFEPKTPGDTPVKKSSLKKSETSQESDEEEEKIDYLEHVVNNVEDIFNSLKTSDAVNSGSITAAKEVSTICTNDDEQKTTEETSTKVSEESNVDRKRKKSPSPEETNADSETECSTTKRKRSQSPEKITKISENSENESQENLYLNLSDEKEENTENDLVEGQEIKESSDSEIFIDEKKTEENQDEANLDTDDKKDDSDTLKEADIHKKAKNVESENDKITPTDKPVQNGDNEVDEDGQDASIENKTDQTDNAMSKDIQNSQEDQSTENLFDEDSQDNNKMEDKEKSSEQGECKDTSEQVKSNLNNDSHDGVESKDDAISEQDDSSIHATSEDKDENQIEDENDIDENNLATDDMGEETQEKESVTANTNDEWKSEYEPKNDDEQIESEDQEHNDDFNDFKTVDSCDDSINGDEESNEHQDENKVEIKTVEQAGEDKI